MAGGRKLSPQEAKAEAAKLALSSFKDIGSLLSPGGNDAVQPIDTTPVFENPKLFGDLSLLHQGQVLQELQDKFDKSWKKLTTQDKLLGYYISYGDWGVREKFTNWNTHSPPLDLPFRIPTEVRKSNPKPHDKIRKLEPLYLAETDVRKEQFGTKKMDAVTKTFIYLAIFIAMLALARDKRIGEAGKPVEQVVEDQYLKQKQLEKELEEEKLKQALQQKASRRWYYLWLK